jgi:hypothetical protein
MNAVNPPAGAPHAAAWQEHEHVAPPLQVQAQKLVDEAGSPELAKQAVDSAASGNPPPAVLDAAFGQMYGFDSAEDLFAASTPIGSADRQRWWVTQLGTSDWVAWNEADPRGNQVFESMEAAVQHIHRQGEGAPLGEA